MVKRLLPFVLTIAICTCQAAEVNQPSRYTHAFSPTGFIKGHSWGWVGTRGQYLGDAPAESMKKLAETNANWVCIAFGAEMNKPDDTNILWGDNDPCMVTDNEIRRAIELARKNNLKVILKPTVNVRDGTWRGYIQFKNPDGKTIDVNAWGQWWGNFNRFILHYAQIAKETNCEMLCLGCEMGTTEPFVDRWRNLIAEVRKVYPGAITYNANHGNETKVRWWDATDVIGISGYYAIGADDEQAAKKDPNKVLVSDTSVEALKRRVLPIKENLRKVSQRYDRPVFFIELGMCSAKGCSAAPFTHNDPNTMIYDGDEQARFYQAMLEAFWDEPWFIGYAWWDWHTDLYSLKKAKTDTTFCIYGKPAEKVVKEWYSKPR
ncbi:MAG: hypothetical protein ABSA64_03130 [Sedimentisphaerales bacterium]|jgi:hypothetical protein